MTASVASVAFVACVERGPLEQKTGLLVRSIRRFGGIHRDAPIHTFSPRAGRDITAATRDLFDEGGVTHHEERLNVAFDEYGVGNKIFAAARAEELAAEEFLVFLDSDTVIVAEPGELALGDGVDAAVRPVEFHRWLEPDAGDQNHWRTHHRRAGSAGEAEPGDDYWLRMYELCGIANRPYVETSCDRVRIRAYANSGLVAVRREAGIFGQWLRDFLTLTAAGHRPNGGDMHYMDQLSLAATLARIWGRVQLLDGRYNYPLVGRPLLAEPLRSARLDELVHIHYNTYFHRPGFLASLQPAVEREGEVISWLHGQLPLGEGA
jgi:hypothetical protein